MVTIVFVMLIMLLIGSLLSMYRNKYVVLPMSLRASEIVYRYNIYLLNTYGIDYLKENRLSYDVDYKTYSKRVHMFTKWRFDQLFPEIVLYEQELVKLGLEDGIDEAVNEKIRKWRL